MAEVLFYHLERSPLEVVLPELLEKTLARGWRAVVSTGSQEAAKTLDSALWSFSDESFLPHGLVDHPSQPIWLTVDGAISGVWDVLFLVAGASCPAVEFNQFTRTVVMFDTSGAEAARALWKDVKAENYDATYWRQSAHGRWEKVA